MNRKQIEQFLKDQREWTLTVEKEIPIIDKIIPLKNGKSYKSYRTEREKILNEQIQIKGLVAAKAKAKKIIENKLSADTYPENNLPTKVYHQGNWIDFTSDPITPLNYSWKRNYKTNNGEKWHSSKIKHTSYIARIIPKQPSASDYNDQDGYPYNPDEIRKDKYQTFEYWTNPDNILESHFTYQNLPNETIFTGVKLCGFKTKLYCSNQAQKIWLDTSQFHSQLQSEIIWHSNSTIDNNLTENVSQTKNYNIIPTETLEKITRYYLSIFEKEHKQRQKKPITYYSHNFFGPRGISSP